MKIFIDAGHNYSGFNTGAAGNGLKEQDVTWEIAKLCGEVLAKSGIKIKLSRPNLKDNIGTDNSGSLAMRCKMANDWGADFFVSIHCNAGGGTGTESFCYKAGTTAEKLAIAVNSSVVSKLGTKNRGVKTAGFYVLLNTKMPAILVETAFVDNANDALLLKNNKAEFAHAISDGIMQFVGGGVSGAPAAQTQPSEISAQSALQKLTEKGIINSPDYWEKAIDVVKNLDQLFIKVASGI
ncbi:MAG: N-acetylmuramoyl-L-alanine amidase [Oscillospiraceae bacterium]|nr:N-acetylmuramoyl-L-alanine amidase [Oscillospiraceae bacterium]